MTKYEVFELLSVHSNNPKYEHSKDRISVGYVWSNNSKQALDKAKKEFSSTVIVVSTKARKSPVGYIIGKLR